MFGAEGQYVFDVELEGVKNLVKRSEFIDFTLSRECGGGLPSFSMNFQSDNLSVLRYLNEGNKLKTSCGQSKKTMKTTNFRLLGDPDLTKVGRNKYNIYINGLLDLPNYFKPVSFISDKKSGLEVLQERAKSRGLTLDKNNILKSDDSQIWIQMLSSDRRFFTHLLSHSYLNKSFPTLAITSTGELRVYDFVEHLKRGVKHRFTSKLEKANDIIINSDFVFLKEKSAILNYWLGYLSDKPVLDLVNSEELLYSEDVKNFLSTNTKLPRFIQEEKRRESLGYTNDFLHKDFWRAYQKNIKNSVLYSRNKIGFTISKTFRNIEPLDFSQLLDPDTRNEQILNSYLSGNYVITKVVDNIQNNQFFQYVEMSRESINELKGDLV